MSDVQTRDFWSVDDEDVLVELSYATIVSIRANGTDQVHIELLVDPDDFIAEAERIKKARQMKLEMQRKHEN